MDDTRYPGADTPEARLALFDFAFQNASSGRNGRPRSRIIRGNAVFACVTGRSLPELVGVAFADFNHPDDIGADLALFDEVLAGKRDGCTVEKRTSTLTRSSRSAFMLRR